MTDNQTIKKLSQQIDELLEQYKQLKKQNAELREEKAGWESERKKLVEKNETAKNRVEAMIDRLKNLELG